MVRGRRKLGNAIEVAEVTIRRIGFPTATMAVTPTTGVTITTVPPFIAVIMVEVATTAGIHITGAA